ncbi:unnamed protein product, partial [marine sediment metagenome]
LFKQDETETYCEELTYNWETKKIILLRLKGELTGEGIKGKVYYQGEKMENFPETVEITEGSFTTCELEEPHYHIVAKEMIIYPKDIRPLYCKRSNEFCGSGCCCPNHYVNHANSF